MTGVEAGMAAVEKVARIVAEVTSEYPWEQMTQAGKNRRIWAANRLIDAFPQLALEGREETGFAPALGYPDEMSDVTRTVWESPWSEVAS